MRLRGVGRQERLVTRCEPVVDDQLQLDFVDQIRALHQEDGKDSVAPQVLVREFFERPQFDLCKLIQKLVEFLWIGDIHLSPFHCGENDENAQHLKMEICMRDAGQVSKFMEYADSPPRAVSKKTTKNARAGKEFLEAINEQK